MLIRERYPILFKASQPLTIISVPNNHYQIPQKNKLLEAVTDMLSKHAIELVSDTSTQGFYSRLFLVPKKTGDWRQVIDLSHLNQHIQCPTFNMDTP
jgi:hypothetical protein